MVTNTPDSLTALKQAISAGSLGVIYPNKVTTEGMVFKGHGSNCVRSSARLVVKDQVTVLRVHTECVPDFPQGGVQVQL